MTDGPTPRLGAADALASADREWLDRVITRRVPLDRWAEALQPRPQYIKTVILFPAIEERRV